MIDNRTMRVVEWVADFAGAAGEPVSPHLICRACVAKTGMCGAWVSIGNPPSVLECTTDPVAGFLEQLQFTLGQGPAVDALRDGEPVAAADLSTVHSRRSWPVFTPPAYAAGARSVVAMPLPAGAVRAGVLGMYSRRPTVLTAEQRTDLGVFAAMALGLVLDRDHRQPGAGKLLWDRAEVHQAAGMISVQLGVDVADALVRLRAHAFAEGRPLVEIAREVVTRRLRFSPATHEKPASWVQN